MKILKQLIFAVALIVCVSVSVSAQKDEGKRPKKGNPPIIVVGNDGKKPKEDKPKEDDRRKKPQINFFFRLED